MKRYVILALIVLATAGGIGYWVYQAHQGNEKQNTTTQPASSQSTSTKTSPNSQPTPTTTPDPSEGGKYLVIKEWGVRFLLPEELRGGVEYQLTTSGNNRETAWFRIDKLANLPASKCDFYWGSNGNGLTLDRGKERIADDQAGYYYEPNMHVGDYWYGSSLGKYSNQCVPDESGQQLVGDTARILLSSIDKLEDI